MAGRMDKGTGDSAIGATGRATRGYAAFISYSHADEAIAKKLHRRLETYKLPPKLRQDDSDKRIGTIFRDRADLAAASSLSEAIRTALAQSAALIVLCSPEAKASQWVDGEIRLFRELHPDDPVLAVIVRGEPGEAMPLALIENGREPLAADLRKEGDGSTLAFLKVVAALKELPLDSLIQRDAQRQLVRVTRITVVVGLALVAMLAMTIFAISAQREAERQRAEAEGLIDYMMTELRTRLRGVGSSEVQNAVSDRAMDYYRSQGDLSALPADSLRRRAIILHAMGEDESGRGNADAALARFSEAHRTTSALLALAPSDADRLFAHAQSEYWLGFSAQGRQDFATARRHFAAYRRLAGRLSAVDLDKNRAQTEIGYAEGNLCSLELIDTTTDRPATAHCRNALDAMASVAQRRPTDPAAQIALANRYAWLSNALQNDEQRDSGIAELAEANRITEVWLARDPGNADYMDLLAGNLFMLAERQVEARQFRNAERTLDRADALLTVLVRRDADRRRWTYLSEQAAALRQRSRAARLN